jgi:hypothetical protein
LAIVALPSFAFTRRERLKRRLRRSPQRIDRRRRPLSPSSRTLRRVSQLTSQLLQLLDLLSEAGSIQRLRSPQILARAERAGAAGEDDRAHRRVGYGRSDRRAELSEHGQVKRVEHLWAVERNRPDALGDRHPEIRHAADLINDGFIAVRRRVSWSLSTGASTSQLSRASCARALTAFAT